jgi:clan AA aspartic protease (TIGR02281 family)
MKNNAYEILEVAQSASQEVLDASYKVLIAKYSQDLKDDPRQLASVIKVFSDAYDTLSDPLKRAAHNEEIKSGRGFGNITQSIGTTTSLESIINGDAESQGVSSEKINSQYNDYAKRRTEINRHSHFPRTMIFLALLFLIGIGFLFQSEIIDLVAKLRGGQNIEAIDYLQVNDKNALTIPENVLKLESMSSSLSPSDYAGNLKAYQAALDELKLQESYLKRDDPKENYTNFRNKEKFYRSIIEKYLVLTLGENSGLQSIPATLAKQLTLEPCDNQLHRKVIKYLRTSDQSRVLADLALEWATECKLDKSIIAGYYLESTMNYRSIGQTDKAKFVAEQMVELIPQSGQARMQLAASLVNLGQHEDAIEQYTWVFQLIHPSTIGYSIYNKVIDSLEHVGRGCDAIDFYRLMLRQKKPGNAEDVQSRIDGLQNKFTCGSIAQELIRIATKNGQVSTVKVSINGVGGNFVFDTGASVTSVNLDFANKSGLKLNSKSKVKIHTANGSSFAFNSHSEKIQVENVDIGSGQIIVLQNTDSLGKYDGLLGMNIISRFDIDKNGSEWILKNKYQY